MSAVRSAIKRFMSASARKVPRAMLHYAQRNFRWIIILWQVRGTTWRDRTALMCSALAAPFLGMRGLQEWQDPILLRDVAVEVLGIGSFSLRSHTDDLWHVLPWREQAIIGTLRSTLKPGDVFIDAGANVGIYTVLASRLVGAHGRVFSIEMMPDTADRLESHTLMNGLQNVTIVRNALSDVAGRTVRATVPEHKHGQATIVADSIPLGEGRIVEVVTTTLDAITAEITRARLAKIDLEGAELQALHGAATFLSKVDAVIYESWGWKRGSGDPVDGLLEKAGFSLKQLDGNNWIAECPVR